MKLIGVLGGLSWESSAEYYRIINQEIARRCGGLSSARVLLSSVDFSFYAQAMEEGCWDLIHAALVQEALRLKRGGAEGLVIATNTMHRFASELGAVSGLPLIHIADATATAAKASKAKIVGLMGTRYTMEGEFYRKRLQEVHGLQVLVPEEAERTEINRIIFSELCAGSFKDGSTKQLVKFAEKLAARGADGIILGCTELPLVMKDGVINIPFWDTTRLHCLAAVDFMLENPVDLKEIV
ncbi:aspartate/glutamate racemase [Treponema sp.]